MPASPARSQKIAIVGAGMVGLSTAWFLQEHGMDVTVFDRQDVASGSSWGNAGWLTPGIATPLPEPAVLKYGLRAVLNPSSPVYVPPSADKFFLKFVAGFTKRSTMPAWKKAMGSLVPINDRALAAFDALGAGGVDAATYEAKSFIAAYRTEAERETLLEEMTHIKEAGQDIRFDVLTGDQARAIEPALSHEIGAALLLHDQRYVNPGVYVNALADSVRARGARLEIATPVRWIDQDPAGMSVTTERGETEQFEAVVIATGAWLGLLARDFGVKKVVQAGRGYSFSVAMDRVPNGPVYFPAARVACTPVGDRLRVAGMMEFRKPEAPLDRRRVKAIVEAARPLLAGADLDNRKDEWVGSRPCTSDGLPLIGVTANPRVYVAGGHGMWGITLGPVTGQLLAQQIATGLVPQELLPFSPTR
ncbi:MAG: FAD-dependent oxidoreductase [Dermatophilaceae bacterium]